MKETHKNEASLNTRMYATLLLLPLTNDQNKIAQANFNGACSYAWKAASVYAQSMTSATFPVEPRSPLSAYHEQIGKVLDCTVLKVPNTRIPLNYVEYSAYRILHTCILPPTELLNQGRNKGSFFHCFLNVIVLAVMVRNRLEGIGERVENEDLLTFCEDTIRDFEMTFVGEVNNLNPEEFSRSAKLLTMVSLHRSIFIATRRENGAGDEKSLHLAGIILTKCIAPYLSLLMNVVPESSSSQQLFETIIECYIRPLSAFEKLSNHYIHEEDYESGTYFANLCDEAIEELHRFVSKAQSKRSAVLAKCAKSISIIGRQRVENSSNGSSIIPFLRSIALYNDTIAAEKSEGCGDNCHHLSTRLTQLANVYHDMGRLEECCLVLAAVLRVEVAMNQHTTKGKVPEQDFADLLASKSKSVVSPLQVHCEMNPLLTLTIKRLISIFPVSLGESALESQSARSCLDLRGILDILLDTERTGNPAFQSVAGCLGSQVNLSSLLCAVFQPVTMAANNEMTSGHLTMLLESILQLGARISRVTDEDCTDDVIGLLSNHDDLVELAVVSIAHRFEPLVTSALTSLLYLVSSTSLLPVRTFFEDTTHGTNIRVTNDVVMKRTLRLASQSMLGIRAVNSSEMKDEWDGISAAIRLSVTQYYIFLELVESPKVYPTQGMIEFLSLCDNTTKIVLCNDWTRRETKQWMMWNLMNTKSRLDFEGDHTRAARLAFLVLTLADKSEAAEMEWLSSVFIESYQRIPRLQRRFDLSVNNEIFESANSTDHKSLDWLVSQGLRLSLSMLNGRNDEYIDNDRLTEIAKCENQRENSLLSMWLLSSLAIAQTQLAHQSGNVVVALKQIQLCTMHCQRILAETRYSSSKKIKFPFWLQVARMTLFIQASHRYAECLIMKSQTFIQLGDHRKAWSCILTIPRVLGVDANLPKITDRTLMLQHTISSLMSSKPLILRRFNRLRVTINCLFSPSDLVAQQFRYITPDKLVSGQNEGLMDETIQDLVSAGDILYGSAMTSRQHSDFKSYYACLPQFQLSSLSAIPSTLELPINMTITTSGTYSSKLSLLKARCLLHDSTDSDEVSYNRIGDLCHDVINDHTSSSIDKAWAHYYIGTMALDATRNNGDLTRLWQGQGAITSKSLAVAKKSFSNAISEIENYDNNVFYRTLIRSLALVSGPESGQLSGSVSGMLVLTSIGHVGRRQMSKSLDGKQGAEDLVSAFSCFDRSLEDDSGRNRAILHFLDALAAVTPKVWHFVAAAICPTGELLLTSLGKGESSGNSFCIETKCVFPKEERYCAYDEILRPLDKIIHKSQQHLQGMDPDQVSANYTKESAKRDWWSVRNQIDETLCYHILEVEENFFSTIHLRINSKDSIFEENESSDLPCGNLASRFEAACNPSTPVVDDEMGEKSLWNLTVPKLKNILRRHNFSDSQMRKMRKHEIIETILEVQEKKKQKELEISTDGGNRSCLFLLLDENLQRFPFEGMESLEGKPVFRVPSLPFVYATLRERMKSNRKGISLDPYNATYVLDPESNLESTQKRLLPVLEGLSSSHSWDWDGVVGRPPTPSFFENALMKKHGLVIFIGHGGAQTCYSRRNVEQMISGESGRTFRTCNASLILMGCSSGRLLSVNQKDSKSLEQLPLHFDPEGIALSYLCAGAPCVVGNLWDVTDHDIDRFSISLFEKFFGESGNHSFESLGYCVANSRSSCKLRYIVGCAPVCYGVPVFCS
ncbi:unnamed protein product [Cylindrotheca closterium]|uniref:separase n=1 Tax=Cylindrotheca closterium TaxID=2856 RepID=A0AAD2FQY8_9STRA|nr:unnamed protein product [Cylindrotheca closterium]